MRLLTKRLEKKLCERDPRIKRLQDFVYTQEAVIATDNAKIKHLRLLIAKLHCMRFGGMPSNWTGKAANVYCDSKS